MSDDTPTQRFPNSDSGDTPTQRLDTGEVQEDLQEEKQKSQGPADRADRRRRTPAPRDRRPRVLPGEPRQGEPTSPSSDTPIRATRATPTPTPSETPAADADALAEQTSESQQPAPTTRRRNREPHSALQPDQESQLLAGWAVLHPRPAGDQDQLGDRRADSAWIVMGTSDAADFRIHADSAQRESESTSISRSDYPCPDSATYTITLVGSEATGIEWTVTADRRCPGFRVPSTHGALLVAQ